LSPRTYFVNPLSILSTGVWRHLAGNAWFRRWALQIPARGADRCGSPYLEQGLAKQLVDLLRIGFSLGLFHDLADEKTEDFLVAIPVLLYLVCVLGKD